jgi:crotonobetainyl-CoA:carnitine CoA-transferase CaiB-like acyl-CoA transferase
MAGSLRGIRVLDLSRVLAGPWATQTLADLGAEVIKIERPGIGDDTRAWGPPYLRHADGTVGQSAYFLSTNRGKRSVTIDFTKDEGQKLIRELAERSDVLVENYKVGGLAKLGLDYAALSARIPRLIYCSITGFGQTGPYGDKPGYDLLVQAMGGLMSLTGEPDGEPMKVGVAITDILTGLYATIAILAALHERERSGLGQHIDLALLDVQIATLANQAANYLVAGVPPLRYGNAHPSIVPYQAFATSDGSIVIAVGNDAQFARFAAILGMPLLAEDDRFRTNAERVRNRQVLLPLVVQRLVQRPARKWLEELDRAQIPAGPINTVDAVFNDPHVAARQLLVELKSNGDTVPLVGSPIHLSRTPVSYESPPPKLGAHTAEVLGDILGRSPVEIQALRERGVI